MNDRITRMQALLTAALAPSELQIIDESEQHRGHAGAASGAGHYQINITAAAFIGKPLLERHRLVYDALQSMLPQEIHALRIKAQIPKSD